MTSSTATSCVSILGGHQSDFARNIAKDGLTVADLVRDKMFQMNAGYFLIQLASEKDKESVYKLIGDNIRADANGVKQVAFIGVIDPLNPEVETPEQVRDDLVTAAKYIPPVACSQQNDRAVCTSMSVHHNRP